MIMLGLAAIAEPVTATIAVRLFVGWLFLIVGIAGLATIAFARNASFGFWTRITTSLLAAAIGIFLIWGPFGGVISLTLAATAFFGTQGVAQLILAIGGRAKVATWTWFLLSSFVNFSLAGVALSGVPERAIWALGLMFGTNLLLWGLAQAMTALACRTSPAVG